MIMSIIKDIKKDILKIYNDLGYEVDDVLLLPSNRRDLGEYQLNDCMKLAGIYHKNPRVIAEEVKSRLEIDNRFKNINIQFHLNNHP